MYSVFWSKIWNMFLRQLKPSPRESFFIFGARGTGKSTFLRSEWKQQHHYLSFLEDRWERRYSDQPDLLKADLLALNPRPTWVVIDEVQKVPKILDIVHDLIETESLRFVLTGSSARKLKKSHANLLAGRAFQYEMFPLTARELGDRFDLDEVLAWGSLPKLYSLDPADRAEYLRSYCQTYLREEILQEQIVRNGGAFRNFLEIAAQENGNALNFAKIAQGVGVDPKTVVTFFDILEDTLVGKTLPAYDRSARRSAGKRPKFYLFDLGIKRALEGSLDERLRPKTSSYGKAFEHFVVSEVIRLNSYSRKDYRLFHYQTNAGGEIDLVLKKGRSVLSVEIKSTRQVDLKEVAAFRRVSEGIDPTECFYVSQDPTPSRVEGVECLPWSGFLARLF